MFEDIDVPIFPENAFESLPEEPGRGGMGEVVFGVMNGSYVAVKRVLDKPKWSDSERERVEALFERDMKFAHFLCACGYEMYGLDSPIVRVKGQLDGEDGGLVMKRYPFDLKGFVDYVDGLKFRDRYLPVLVLDILRAVKVAHDNGVLLRDIKVENFLVTLRPGLNGVEYRAVLTDFGLAKKVDGEMRSFAGTPLTMAPEVIGQGFQNGHFQGLVGLFRASSLESLGVLGNPIDLRSDLYSLGVVLFYLVYGKYPFVGSSEKVVLLSNLFSEVREWRGTDYDDLLRKLLSKNPDDRYQTIDEVMADFERICAGLGVTL